MRVASMRVRKQQLGARGMCLFVFVSGGLSWQWMLIAESHETVKLYLICAV